MKILTNTGYLPLSNKLSILLARLPILTPEIRVKLFMKIKTYGYELEVTDSEERYWKSYLDKYKISYKVKGSEVINSEPEVKSYLFKYYPTSRSRYERQEVIQATSEEEAKEKFKVICESPYSVNIEVIENDSKEKNSEEESN